MDLIRVYELMDIESQCIHRNIFGCDRDCKNCDLLQKDKELLEAYKIVKSILKDMIMIETNKEKKG